MSTNVGTLLLNDALPDDLRKPEGFRLDKQGMHQLLRQVAELHPEQYKDVLKRLNDIGRRSVYTTGHSVSLSALRRSPAKEGVLKDARQQIDQVVNDDSIPEEQKDRQIVDLLLPLGPKLQDALFAEAKKENNPYYLQLISGSRGKKSDYNSLRGADLLTADHTGKIIPIPIVHSYAEGLDPVEYWAGLYGQRRGAVGVKFSTGDAGFAGKQLVNAAHRIVVTKEAPEPTRLPVGLPVDATDPDNVGAVLAAPVKVQGKDYPAGTVITPELLNGFKDGGTTDQILIHSPLTEPTPDGGVSRLAAGRRDRFGLSRIGDNLGIPAAQSVSEKLSQGALSSKHSSGVAKAGVERAGFEYLNRLIQAPEHFPEAGPLADQDGAVTAVEPAPQGGHYVTVGQTRHYAHPALTPTVTVGDTVEAGQDLTDGVPHPAELIKHRGLGEARRVYLGLLGEALENSGVPAHRRNLETVVAGLLNWAKVDDPDGIGEHVVDDVVGYNQLAHQYRPRADAQLLPPGRSVGRYLEEPALHYSIGTRVTRRVADQLEKHGIRDLHTHHEPPGFTPIMQRGLLGVHEDPDWQTQQAGFYTSSAFAKSLARGATSDPNSTSFVPALARGTDFGKNLSVTGHYG